MAENIGQRLGQLGQTIGQGMMGAAKIETEQKALREKQDRAETPSVMLEQLGKKIYQEMSSDNPDKAVIAKYQDQFNKLGKITQRIKTFNSKMKETYGDKDGNIPEQIGVTSAKISRPTGLTPFPKKGSKGAWGAVAEWWSGDEKDPDYEKAVEDWKIDNADAIRAWGKERVSSYDPPAHTDFSNAVFEDYKSEAEDDDYKIKSDFTVGLATGYIRTGGKQRKGLVKRKGAPTRGRTKSGKIMVRKGTETREIDKKDLKDAQKDGYKIVNK